MRHTHIHVHTHTKRLGTRVKQMVWERQTGGREEGKEDDSSSQEKTSTLHTFFVKGEIKDGHEGEGNISVIKTFRTAAKVFFMRRDKAANRWLERKNMASLSGCEEEVNSRKRKRERETKRGKQAQCPKQQLLWNKWHFRANYPETQKALVTSHFASTVSQGL